MDTPSDATPGVTADTGNGRHWAERLAHGRLGIAVLSVLESTIVPVPLETLLAPVMISYPQRAWVLALMATIGALIGATLMYVAGFYAFDWLREALSAYIDFSPADDFIARLDGQAGFWAVFLVALGPLPLQMATLGAGAAKINFAVYIVGIGISRAIRYFGMAWLCREIGERIRHLKFSKRVMIAVTAAFLLLLWGGYELLTSAD